jgi:ribose 1,5-bisphosphokinase PhnN
VTAAAFDALEAQCAFALAWGAHGLRYGVRASEIAALSLVGEDEAGRFHLIEDLPLRAHSQL